MNAAFSPAEAKLIAVRSNVIDTFSLLLSFSPSSLFLFPIHDLEFIRPNRWLNLKKSFEMYSVIARAIEINDKNYDRKYDVLIYIPLHFRCISRLFLVKAEHEEASLTNSKTLRRTNFPSGLTYLSSPCFCTTSKEDKCDGLIC